MERTSILWLLFENQDIKRNERTNTKGGSMRTYETMSIEELESEKNLIAAELKKRQTEDKKNPIILMNLMQKICPEIERYNGGWTKTITGLDKTKTNGYSLQGDFIKAKQAAYYENGTIFLDCDIDGSRKNQERNYRLFLLKSGKLTLLDELPDGDMNWALEFWEIIESTL